MFGVLFTQLTKLKLYGFLFLSDKVSFTWKLRFVIYGSELKYAVEMGTTLIFSIR